MSKYRFLTNFNEEDIIHFYLAKGEMPAMMKLRSLRSIFRPFLKGFISDVAAHRLKKIGLESKRCFENHEYVNCPENLLEDGIECEILKLGNTEWQSGRIRIQVSVEFVPDEIEESPGGSLLDEIRQEISNTSQPLN